MHAWLCKHLLSVHWYMCPLDPKVQPCGITPVRIYAGHGLPFGASIKSIFIVMVIVNKRYLCSLTARYSFLKKKMSYWVCKRNMLLYLMFCDHIVYLKCKFADIVLIFDRTVISCESSLDLVIWYQPYSIKIALQPVTLEEYPVSTMHTPSPNDVTSTLYAEYLCTSLHSGGHIIGHLALS